MALIKRWILSWLARWTVHGQMRVDYAPHPHTKRAFEAAHDAARPPRGEL